MPRGTFISPGGHRREYYSKMATIYKGWVWGFDAKIYRRTRYVYRRTRDAVQRKHDKFVLLFVKENMSTAVLSRLHVKRHEFSTCWCVSPGISLAHTAAAKKAPPPPPRPVLVSVRRIYLPFGLLQPRELNPRTSCPRSGRSTHSTQTSQKHF